MTDSQYRTLVAYITYWQGQPWLQGRDVLSLAMEDIGIHSSRELIIDELWSCGWIYDQVHKRLKYKGE